jgi:hypothetical protein
MGISLIQELRLEYQNFDPIQVYHCFPGELSEVPYLGFTPYSFNDVHYAKRSKSMLLAQTEVEIIDGCSALIEKGVRCSSLYHCSTITH